MEMKNEIIFVVSDNFNFGRQESLEIGFFNIQLLLLKEVCKVHS